eukprot:GHVS01055324.1.p1 GENE.GHVS01055324.1~~GHVS01055324.1.p1  ORF type:complete len:828 (+),score=223.14 GHVS01055324.1:436-2919(+)
MTTTAKGTMMINNSANTTTTTVFHVIGGNTTTGANNNNGIVSTTFMHHPTPPPPQAFAGFLPCQPLPPLLLPSFQQPPSYWMTNLLPLTSIRPCALLVSPPTFPPPTRTVRAEELSVSKVNEKTSLMSKKEEEGGAVRSSVVLRPNSNKEEGDGKLLSRYEETGLGKTKKKKIVSDEQHFYEERNKSKRKTWNKNDQQQIEEQQQRNQHHTHCSFPADSNQTIAATSVSGTGGVSRSNSSGGTMSTGSGGGRISSGGSTVSSGVCSRSVRGSRQVQEIEDGGVKREKGRRGSVRCDGIEQFHKTRMCPFIRTGCFRFRRSCCPYAHSDQELRSSPNLVKTAMCRLHAMNRCNKPADECFFAHSIDQLRSTHDFYKSKMCKFWLKGVCRAESVCRYAHGQKDLLSVLAHPPSLTSNSTTEHPSSCSVDSSCCHPVNNLDTGCGEQVEQDCHQQQHLREDIEQTSDNEQGERTWRSASAATDVNTSNDSTGDGGGCGSTSESPTTAYNKQQQYQQHDHCQQHHSCQQEYYQELNRQHHNQDVQEIVNQSQQQRKGINEEETSNKKQVVNSKQEDDQWWWWGQKNTKQQQQLHERNNKQQRQVQHNNLTTTSSDEDSRSSTYMYSSSSISQQPSYYSSTILSSPSTSSRSSSSRRPSPDPPIVHLCKNSSSLGDVSGSSARASSPLQSYQNRPATVLLPSCPPEFIQSSSGCLLTRRVCDWCGGYPGGVVGGLGWEGVREKRQTEERQTEEETQREVNGNDKVNNDHNNNGVGMGLGDSYSWCLDTFGVLRCSRCSAARPAILDRLEELNAHPAAGAILQDLQYSCMYRD